MNQLGPNNVCGVFELRADAERARDELLRSGAGFRPECLVLLTPGDAVRPFAATPAREGLWLRGDAALGALAGGIIGCLLGTLLATGAIPGIPLLWGGRRGGGCRRRARWARGRGDHRCSCGLGLGRGSVQLLRPGG